jgi:hypothetical protein
MRSVRASNNDGLDDLVKSVVQFRNVVEKCAGVVRS